MGRALPPQVGNNYVRAMHMFLDSGGVNYLKEFADQLDGIGQSRTKSSMDIMESKWQIIAELVRLLIELLVIAVLSAFTGVPPPARPRWRRPAAGSPFSR